MLGVGGEIAAVIRAGRIDLVDFVFGETDRAEALQPHTRAQDNHQGQRSYGDFLPRNNYAAGPDRRDRVRFRRSDRFTVSGIKTSYRHF
jgi:hypothetical protein